MPPLTTWPTEEPLCYVFGTPLVRRDQHVGFTEVALLRIEDSETGGPPLLWIPAAVDLEIASEYHRHAGLPGHCVVRMSNPDGLWALWLELMHLTRYYEAEGIGLITHTAPEVRLESFHRTWFIQQYLSRRHPPGMMINRCTDIRQMQSVN